MTRRSRAGEYVVLGCLFIPGILLLGLALFTEDDTGTLFLLAVLLLAVAGGLMLLQAVLPKPRAPHEPSPPNDRAPEG